MGLHSEELYYDLGCFVSSLCPSHERLMTKPAMLTFCWMRTIAGENAAAENNNSFNILCHVEQEKEQ